ncbi:MAG: ATP phosphoribosyltransferase regulatory subunit [Pseudomonadota bacterium]
MSPADDLFVSLGGHLVDPPAILPASIPLELSGEAVRARLCVFTGVDGNEMALRPDLTLPVAQEEAAARASGLKGERVRRYAARAWRLPTDPAHPVEFTQVGFERFGAPATPAVDAAAFAAVSDASARAGAKEATTWIGDLSVFPAFVDALGLTPNAADGLKRAFRQARDVRVALEAGTSEPAGFAAQLRGAGAREARAMVEDVMALSGVRMAGARSLDEIVERLVAKAADAEGGGVPDAARAVLKDVLNVETAPDAVADALARIANKAGLPALEPLIDELAVRFDAIGKTAPHFLSSARFGTPFGRRFNYYDGFVFELFAEGAPKTAPFAAGGRYDRLIADLSEGAASATAIGGVVRPDRIAGGRA